MFKIRLGNDIRLKIELPVDSVTGNKASILSMRAFFVNTTLKNEIIKKYIKKNRFVGRFPIEPFVDEFEPTKYSVNSIGRPKYRALVRNEYKGFGLRPDWKESMPVKDVNITTYESEVERTASPNTVIIDFPGQYQMYEGVYQVVVIAQIYDSGYKNNCRTVTINQNNVFEIVGDTDLEEAVNSPVYLDINNADSNTIQEDIYVTGATYNNNNITITRNDSAAIMVDVSPISGWYYQE